MDKMENYDLMSVQEKWNTLATVANMYYNSDLNQNQIAERLYTSRSKISRMLKEARRLGIVQINIREPWERELELEQRIKKYFSLKNIRIIRRKSPDEESARQLIYKAAAYYLDSIIRENMIIGISWGTTLCNVVSHISQSSHKNIPVTVAPIMGAARISSPEKDGPELSKELALAYGGKYRYIYAPLFVKSEEAKQSLLQDENIKGTLELAQNADIILSSVGSIEHRSWRNFLSEKTMETLEEKGVVGHIGGHFYNIKGKSLDDVISEKMIGIDFDKLKDNQEMVCIALGDDKAEPVIGALFGGYVSTLIIDEKCAGRIIDIVSR